MEKEVQNHIGVDADHYIGQEMRVLGSYINPNPGNCDKAAKWLEAFSKESLTTWDEVVNKFLARFYPPQRVNRLRAKVQTFKQQDGETLYEAWERFKDLTRKCPPDIFNEWVQLHIFYEGLSYEAKKDVDHSSGERTQKRGVLELNSMDALLAQNKMIAAQLVVLTKRMETSQVSTVQAQAPPQEEDVPEVESEWEQANYVNNSSRPPYDPNTKTYNSGWKNHPNFGWENQQSHHQDHNKLYQSNQHNNHNPNHQSNNNRPYHNSQNASYHFTQQTHNNPHQETSTSTMKPCEIKSNFERVETAIAQMSSQLIGAISNVLERQIQTERKMDANQEECRSNIRNQGAAISKLEAQLASLSKQIPMPTHTFSSDTMANPRGKCKAITLRSRKVIEEAFPNQSN
ncbi:probable serine/threonine-protein kinase cdc7 [Arachis ipaensis]|uniref:probable serine/threonine-protein kinase cdc7 n=1 Tax=Arachis ipaensis TaxID=130454 RepID=UPI0007AF6456|nr:probable serine/threonine-protein kinase cdc7 [Arachis ipaensis]